MYGLGHVLFPGALPVVAAFQTPDHTKLGVLMPSDRMLFAPSGHFQIAGKSKPVAGLFMRIQACEWGLSPNSGQHLGQSALVNFYLPAQRAQMGIQ